MFEEGQSIRPLTTIFNDPRMAESILSRLENVLDGTSKSSQIAAAVAGLGAVYVIKQIFTPSPLACISGPPSPSFLTGHLLALTSGKGDMGYCHNITEKYGGIVKLNALFGSEMLYISDPLALLHIQKETDIFSKASHFTVINDLMFGPGLLTSQGSPHKKQRKLLNPIFTTPYIRNLNPTFYAVAYQLRDAMKRQIGSLKASIDMVPPLARVGLELIGQAGMGHNFGSLQGGTDGYIKALKELIPALTRVGPAVPLLPFFVQFGSPTFRRKVVDLLPWAALHNLAHVVDVMHDTTMEIYKHKKQLLFDDGPHHSDGSVGDGKDIITHLFRANAEASIDDALPENVLMAQVTTLLFAATDTTSGALCRMLQLLATHQDLQNRLRAEIVDARKANGGDDLGYQAIDDLQLLSAVIRETLRLYPPGPHVSRRSTRDDTVPLRYPVTSTDGKTRLSSIFIPKGTDIFLGIVSANTDKQIWGPDALEWKPERWLSPLPQSVVDAKVPGVLPGLMTFTNGTKSCIGYRFALQEMKVVLCVLLESFQFTPDVDIEWHMGPLVTPYANGDTSQSRLPLQVECIEA